MLFYRQCTLLSSVKRNSIFLTTSIYTVYWLRRNILTHNTHLPCQLPLLSLLELASCLVPSKGANNSVRIPYHQLHFAISICDEKSYLASNILPNNTMHNLFQKQQHLKYQESLKALKHCCTYFYISVFSKNASLSRILKTNSRHSVTK